VVCSDDRTTRQQPSRETEKQHTSAAMTPRHPRSRRTRGLQGTTRRLMQSGNVGLMWRLIAGTTKPGEARGLLKGWLYWERVARFLWPVSAIPGAAYGLLSFRVTLYRGEPMALSGTATIARGALLGELHCNNRAILELVVKGGNPFAACRADLKSLSDWVLRDPLGRRIEAFYGSTILTVAARRLGFSILEKPVTWALWLEKIFFKGLLILYNEEGLARIDHGTVARNYPADVWLSRCELLRVYHERDGSS